MAWLKSLAKGTARAAGRGLGAAARGGARAAGRGLSVYVLPDSLIPSWKTQQAISRAASSLTKRRKKKKPASGKSSRTPARDSSRPLKPQPPKAKKSFDKNAWGRGDSLSSLGGFGAPSPPKKPVWREKMASMKQRATNSFSRVRVPFGKKAAAPAKSRPVDPFYNPAHDAAGAAAAAAYIAELRRQAR